MKIIGIISASIPTATGYRDTIEVQTIDGETNKLRIKLQCIVPTYNGKPDHLTPDYIIVEGDDQAKLAANTVKVIKRCISSSVMCGIIKDYGKPSKWFRWPFLSDKGLSTKLCLEAIKQAQEG